MIDGEGDPNTSQAYADAVATLYPLAYALRKAIKEASGTAYTVMPPRRPLVGRRYERLQDRRQVRLAVDRHDLPAREGFRGPLRRGDS